MTIRAVDGDGLLYKVIATALLALTTWWSPSSFRTTAGILKDLLRQLVGVKWGLLERLNGAR